MADAVVRDLLTCSICLDTFSEPVSLSCHHSFCRSCLQEHWAQEQSRSCPLCRRRSSKEDPGVNHALRDLSEALRLKLQLSDPSEQKSPAETEPRREEAPTAETEPRREEAPTAETEPRREQAPRGLPQQRSVCPVHPQVPPLFCLDEARCFCALCEFSKHKDHAVLSEEEAEEKLKEPLRSQLQTLKQQRQSCEDLQQKYDQIQTQCEKQTLYCERQITAVFDRLRRHLQEQQDTALRALRQEQDRQSHLLTSQRETLRDNLSSVNHSIQHLEKHLQTPTRDFLLTPPLPTGLRQDQTKTPLPTGLRQDQTQTPLPTGLRQDQTQTPLPTGLRQDQTQSPLPTGLRQDQTQTPLPTGLMLDQAKVLGNLGFRVWRSLRREVRHSPVVLDPNTAHRWLYLSEDLSVVTYGETYQHQLPDIPERFSKYANVLGSEGFSSGTHQWDVEVGDHPRWNIGVVKESVDRKGEASASPKYGIWCLWHRDGKYTNGKDKAVKVKKSPEKIRVKLDHDRGTVSFYDADHMTLLFTHTDTFTEKMFPFFSIGPNKEAKTKEICICESPGEE